MPWGSRVPLSGGISSAGSRRVAAAVSAARRSIGSYVSTGSNCGHARQLGLEQFAAWTATRHSVEARKAVFDRMAYRTRPTLSAQRSSLERHSARFVWLAVRPSDSHVRRIRGPRPSATGDDPRQAHGDRRRPARRRRPPIAIKIRLAGVERALAFTTD